MKISILTPTFNRVNMLKQAIQSVLSQTYSDWELIIKDGCTNNPAVHDIDLTTDSRIIYLLQQDEGITDALNQAAQRATGDIMVEMNDDDMLHDNEVLADIIKQFASHPDLQWLYSRMETIDSNNNPLQVLGRETTLEEMLTNNIVCQPTVFWKRKFFEELGRFDEQFPYAQDYELWIRFFKASQPIFIDRVTAKYRLHNGQITNTLTSLQLIDAEKVRQKHLNS
jgi:glycosyltransferase involved in cell wall biosynthesis